MWARFRISSRAAVQAGTIYPLLAVAEQVQARQPDAEIHFFHSTQAVDQRVFEKTGFGRTVLPASGLYAHPVKFLRFVVTFQQSCKIAMREIAAAGTRWSLGQAGSLRACLPGGT